MVDAACEHCAEAFARPISFAEFLAAFRRERVARGWTAEAVPSDVELRRVIGCDYRVMWTGTDEFWFLDWKEHTRSLAQAIERNAIVGREYSTRYFYRKERRLMQRLQIKTPEELYEVLRRIYVDAAGEAVFGNHLSFGFGKIDRQKQVKHFVTSHSGEPKNILAMEYERAYGFSAGTVEIWLDLFAQTSDSPLSEWTERKTVGEVCAGEPKLAKDVEIERELVCESEKMTMAKSSRMTVSERPDWIAGELIAASVPYVDNRPKGGDLWVIRSNDTTELVERLRTEGADFRFAAAGGRATRHRPAWWVAGYPEHRELTAEEAKGLNSVSARASKLSAASVAGPAAMEASRDCDAATERAHQPESISMPTEKMTGADARATSVAEFLKRELTGDICDASLIRARFSYEFPNEPDITEDSRLLSKAGYYKDHGLLFGAGLTSTEHFNRLLSSSPSFSKGDSGFEEAVWKHPTFRHVLRRALASHRVLLYERPDSYISFLRLHEVLGTNMADIATYAPTVCRDVPAKTPFTIRSLREALGFIHPLDGLDMPDAFYEGLLDVSGLLRTCTMAGTRVFITGIGERFSASMFMEWLVSRNEGISREDVPRLLQRDYGIDYPMASVITAVYHSTVYHDDVGDAYYSSMEVWKQEARNELNKLTS